MAKKAGRPERKLDEMQLEKLDDMAFNNCKDYTIANVLGIDVTTLKKHYSKRLIQKRAEGLAFLRDCQKNHAKTNPVMSIFLGKNYLDQRDSKDMNLTGDVKVRHYSIKDLKSLIDESKGEPDAIAT